MSETRPAETVEELLKHAAAGGYRVSRSKLHSYQRAGLLPRPRQRGLGRGRGTEVLYPAGSAKQLIALRLALEDRRSFRIAGLQLWWDGYDVAPRLIMPVLTTAVEE